MFSFFKRKKQEDQSSQISALSDRLEWLEPLMPVQDGLPRADWSQIYQYVDTHLSESEPSQLWASIAGTWVHHLSSHLNGEYHILESKNFVLLSAHGNHFNNTLLAFHERCLKRLLSLAKGICSDQGHGKYVVMVFSDIDTYYDYISFYGSEEGSFGLSSGMYLNYGYGHFVFKEDDIDMAEPIVAHEMTHALLNHLPLPLWLNEGMAVNMESAIVGGTPERLTRSLFELHQEFWNAETIQEFWTGDSFFRSDEGQRLSYQMAQILVSNISENTDAFRDFINLAKFDDGGEAAMNQIYDLSLADLVLSFLGEGDWQAKPSCWPSN